MTDSDPQLIRHATIDDLDALAAMESECFPAAEAADRSSLRARIETYPECFWLLIDGEIVMAFINGTISTCLLYTSPSPRDRG